MSQICSHPGCKKPAVGKCDICEVAPYCSLECVQVDRDRHRPECNAAVNSSKKDAPITSETPTTIDCHLGHVDMKVHMHEIRVNALVVGVEDHRTLKIIFMPYGGEEPVSVRLSSVKHFHKHMEKSERAKEMRQQYLEDIFFPKEMEGPEDVYPVAGVVPVGYKTTKHGGKVMLANVYIPNDCTYDKKMTMAYADRPNSMIGDLADNQVYNVMMRLTEDKMHDAQTAQIGAQKKWMQHAVKHPGALTKWGHRHHILKKGEHWSEKSLARASKYAAKTPTKTDDRRVALAKTFAKYRKNK